MRATFHLLSFLYGALSTVISAQNTIGLVDFDPESMNEGYFLFYPDRQGSVFLMNECGQVVHEWPDPQYYPSAGFRFLDNGDIMRTGRDTALANLIFNAGGTGQLVQRRNWANDLVWEYTYSSDTACMHHDIEVLPNGNVLIIAWEIKNIEQAVAAGKDTTGYTFDTVWPDKIIEVEPTGGHGGTIVWEWHAWDHMVQDFDDTKANFGVVADHPELIDINYPGSAVPDIHHINSVDYNPALDQIMLCTPFLDELWIIDHSTTTAQAAQHVGGNSGHGGDLLYRWGNPMTYGQGAIADRELVFNHCATWLGPGLPPNDPDAGKIMVFNNRLTVNSSSVDILVPPVDVNGVYAYTPGTAFEPADPEQRFQTSDPAEFHSIIMGGAEKLPNGNIFICSSRDGWLFQLTPDTSIAWSYFNPFMGGEAAAQGTSSLGSGLVFHAFWLAPDHPGLQGHVLDPIGYVELDPNLTFCNLPTSLDGPTAPLGLSLEGNVVTNELYLRSPVAARYAIIDALGRVIRSGSMPPGRKVVPVDDLVPGTYILRSTVADAVGLRFLVLQP